MSKAENVKGKLTNLGDKIEKIKNALPNSEE